MTRPPVVAVAGATGVVGSAVVAAATASGHPVLALVRRPLAVTPAGVDVAVLADLADQAAVAAALAAHGAMFLVCAVAGRDNAGAPDAARRAVEVDLPLALYAAAVAAGCVRRFVLAACPPLACFGVAEMDDATAASLLSPYLRDKAALVRALRAAETNNSGAAVPVTIFQVAAWARDALPLAASLRASRLAPVVNGGASKLQPLADGDLAARVVAGLGRAADAGATVVVGGPQVLTFRQLWLAAGRSVGVAPRFVSLPRAAVAWGALPALRAVGARRAAYMLALAADVGGADLVAGEATGATTVEVYLRQGGEGVRAKL